MKLLLIILGFCIFLPEPDGKHEEGTKAVLYVFEGSDWCTNCARLEKNVLADASFLDQINLLDIRIERIDFPQRKNLPEEIREHNIQVAEKYAFDGIYPGLVIARTDSDRYLRIRYINETVDEMLVLIRENLSLLYE